MTDNDIIKALEEEKKYVMGLQHRLECHGEETPGLIKNCVLLSNTLNLINRQKAEIEQWKEEANKHQNLWCEAVMDVQTAKAEAIKEFAEKLKSHKRRMCGNDNGGLYWDQAVLVDDIDRVMKEMTEDKE